MITWFIGWLLVCVVLPLIVHYMWVAPYEQYVRYTKEGKVPYLVLDDRLFRATCYEDKSLRPKEKGRLMSTGLVYYEGSLVVQHRRDPRPQLTASYQD